MSDFIISIIGNKIFSEIINEIKLFSKFKIKNYFLFRKKKNFPLPQKNFSKKNFTGFHQSNIL